MRGAFAFSDICWEALTCDVRARYGRRFECLEGTEVSGVKTWRHPSPPDGPPAPGIGRGCGPVREGVAAGTLARRLPPPRLSVCSRLRHVARAAFIDTPPREQQRCQGERTSGRGKTNFWLEQDLFRCAAQTPYESGSSFGHGPCTERSSRGRGSEKKSMADNDSHYGDEDPQCHDDDDSADQEEMFETAKDPAGWTPDSMHDAAFAPNIKSGWLGSQSERGPQNRCRRSATFNG